jgi:lactoylglutathione lyase
MPEASASIAVHGLAHIGIRVHDLARSVAFYELLGFTKTVGPIGPEPVVILEHPCGLELNLVLNASHASEPNILMAPTSTRASRTSHCSARTSPPPSAHSRPVGSP